MNCFFLIWFVSINLTWKFCISIHSENVKRVLSCFKTVWIHWKKEKSWLEAYLWILISGYLKWPLENFKKKSFDYLAIWKPVCNITKAWMYKSFKNEDYYEKNTHLPFDPMSKIHYTFTFIISFAMIFRYAE